MMTVGISEMSLYQEHFYKAYKNSTENFTGVIDRPVMTLLMNPVF